MILKLKVILMKINIIKIITMDIYQQRTNQIWKIHMAAIIQIQSKHQKIHQVL